MKVFISIAIALLAFQAQAVDTSGCSQMNKEKKSVNTANNLLLTIISLKSPFPNCWNSKDASVSINYEWIQKNSPDTPKVIFWTRLNGQEKTLDTETYCYDAGTNRTQADTSGSIYYHCVASAKLSIAGLNPVELEIAPQVNGKWDTAGYGQNYYFRF